MMLWSKAGRGSDLPFRITSGSKRKAPKCSGKRQSFSAYGV